MTESSLPPERPCFSIRRDHAGRLPALVLEGELDLMSAPELAAAIESFGAGDVIVVDLCELKFMDSTGLRELMRAAAVLGDGLRIVCRPAGPVRRLFDVAAVEAVLRVYPSRAEALRAVQVS